MRGTILCELLDRHACCRLKNHTSFPRPTCLFWQLSSFWRRKSIAFMQMLRLLCDFFMLIRLICPVLHVEHLCFIWFLYKNCGPLSNQVVYYLKNVGTASLYFYFYVPEWSFGTSKTCPAPVKIVNDNLSNFISQLSQWKKKIEVLYLRYVFSIFRVQNPFRTYGFR